MKGHPVTHFPTVGFMLHLISQVRNLRAPSCEDPIFFFEKNIDFGEFQHETTKTREGVRFVSFFFFFFLF